MKISVIIPIYNVERFITRCAISLMKQTLKEDVEFIFVDDATPDRSIDLLQEVINQYPERRNQVRLIRHAKNKGLPAARNSGLKVAVGEYIFHCDSDDWLELDMLETLYDVAVKKQADIVWCDWWLSFKKNERYMKQPQYETPMEALKAMLSGVMKYNVWNKLVKHTLYLDSHIMFPEGYGMGEDMTMIRLFARAKRVIYLPKAFYHYVQLNTTALTKTYSDNHLIELYHNVTILLNELSELFGNQLNQELAFFKLDVKFPFLISDNKSKYLLWEEWYPEANKYIWKNKQLSIRSRLLQWLAYKRQFWAIRIYYIFFFRFIYGFIYH